VRMVCVKVNYGDDIRRIRLEECTLASLKKVLQTVYNVDDQSRLPENYMLTYVDEDGDTIMISSEMEFREGVRFAKNGLLRLTIVPASQGLRVEENLGVEKIENDDVINNQEQQEEIREELYENLKENADLTEEVKEWFRMQMESIKEVLENVVSEPHKQQLLEKAEAARGEMQQFFQEFAGEERRQEFKLRLQQTTQEIQTKLRNFAEQHKISESMKGIQIQIESTAASVFTEERKEKIHQLWSKVENQVQTTVQAVITPDRQESVTRFFSEVNETVTSFLRQFFDCKTTSVPNSTPVSAPIAVSVPIALPDPIVVPVPEPVPIRAPKLDETFVFSQELLTLQNMGFADTGLLKTLLVENDGSVLASLDILLS